MNYKNKTVYLWDLMNTLFPNTWNKELTGYDSFDEYVTSLGVDSKSPRVYEEAYREPYIHGEMYNLSIAGGYKEVLSWTKYNEIFTTGLPETNDWRAEYLNPRVGFDIRSFFQNQVSTFDYGETNQKTQDMLVDYLMKKYQEGFATVVYTDDKLSNGQFFLDACSKVKKIYPDFSCRLYHILNDDGGLRAKDGYWQIGSLYDLLANEKRLHT